MMVSHTDSTDENVADESRTLRMLCYVGIATTIVALLALGASQANRGLIAAVGIATLITLSSGAVGAVLGFLFALPRVLSNELKDEPVSADSTDSVKRRLVGTNTNLERLSDWLTTIIVGVGLTQLGQLNAALNGFRIFIAETAKVFPDGAYCDSECTAGTLPNVAPMLLILGFIGGFLALYLFTRLKMSGLFHKVEEEYLNLLSGQSAAAVKQTAKEASVVAGAGESPAIKAVLASQQPTVDEGLSLMFSLLYRPNGYQRVIDLGGELINTAASRRPDFWFYLAAAFGQKYSSLKASAAPPGEIQSAKDNALDCARRAVDLDSQFKDRLWYISDPEGIDNDLADLRDDPNFRKIVGDRARRPPST